ncbi:DUF1853 family protein [Salinicola avicenniae]|uniref:DUF1853 family protein n=1 Tax=Salinicola avicenniae TaxID=2916836 RepID=UPI002074175E|nr:MULTISPECIES: DUF1853 family protein [unclassified Salinicola]
MAGDLAISTHAWIRDIAWLLHTPDMVDLACAGRPSLDALGLADTAQRRRWLAAQEGLAARFQRRFQQRPARLGLYHELLWQWILEHAPLTRLLAHNVTLKLEGRTLGELDLFYTTRRRHDCEERPRLEHAELAIKFFLGLPTGPGSAGDAGRWVGVGSFDSLAIKSHRLMTRQLPMGASAAAASAREKALPGAVLHQRIIMPGVLYHPWRQPLGLPTLATDSVLQGLWCHHADWPALRESLPAGTRAHMRYKPHWLAPPLTPPQPLAMLDAALGTHFAQRSTPRHLELQLSDGRSCRLYIVSDAWPLALPLPPHAASPSGR